MKRFERWTSLVAVCLALSNVGFPQASSSSLRGTVTDPSGSAIPGAAVVIANAESKTERNAGEAQHPPQLPASHYADDHAWSPIRGSGWSSTA